MKLIFTLLCMLFSAIISHALAAATADTVKIASPATLQTATGTIHGTLLMPAGKKNIPLVIIIAGSGPTDRDGNNGPYKNNSLKMLARELGNNGIATLRYDKRGIATSKEAGKAEKDLRFEDYIADAAAWVTQFKADKRFGKIIVAGHSEGSLIGMIAANNAKADAYISLAGAGEPADKILKTQFQSQPFGTSQVVDPIIDSLAQGNMVNRVPPALNAIFRPSVQPYLISWFKYDPAAEIKKLTIPTLIVQGTTDIQVSASDAKALAAAQPRAALVLIDGMNHIFKQAPADRAQNFSTYTNPALPLAPELILRITAFIEGLK